MRLFERVGPNEVSLNNQWLPTFIGMNRQVNDAVGRRLAAEFTHQVLNDETLDRLNARAIEVLVEMFPECHGLSDYLDGLKFVSIGRDGA